MTPFALISGATGGIGTVVTQYLWHHGYSLLCLGRTDAKVQALHHWLSTNTSSNSAQHWLCRSADLTREATYAVIKEYLRCFPMPVTLLVVCHGAAPRPVPAEDTASLQGMREVFETDVLSTHRLCRLAWHQMSQGDGGSIVLVSSLHSQATYPLRLPYSTAKSALSGMTRSLALDWGRWNIRVNSMCPWQTEGSRTAQVAAKEGEDTMERYRQKSPLRRLVDPQDIAKTVLWLAECQSITGAEITIDCGVSASAWHRGFLENQ